jgi:hypothetical protein
MVEQDENMKDELKDYPEQLLLVIRIYCYLSNFYLNINIFFKFRFVHQGQKGKHLDF